MLLKLFGYTISIRKNRQMHPRNCRGYAEQCSLAKAVTTASLRKTYGKSK